MPRLKHVEVEPRLVMKPLAGSCAAKRMKSNYVAATRGKNYAFIYTYTGKDFNVQMGKIKGGKVKASWYNPKDGSSQPIGNLRNKGLLIFNPPGAPAEGNDWVLVLERL